MLVNTTQAASLLGVSSTRVRMLLKQNRIVGAYKIGKFWVIPLTDGLPIVSKGTRGPSTSFKSARKSAKSIIHINRQKVARNHQQSKDEPVITVKCGNTNTYGHEVEINGPCRIVYSQDRTLFGARVWIETFSRVEVFCKNVMPILSAS
ncbi:MAG: helix-turn-helix domain-containing protein [Xenococcaceae cyanobacterium]